MEKEELWAQGRSRERTVVPFVGCRSGERARWPGRGRRVIGMGWHVQTHLTKEKFGWKRSREAGGS